MKFIDSHSHIYAEEFSNDLQEVVQRAKEVGVERILLPNIDVESIPLLKNTYGLYPEYTCPMMGLHPTSIGEHYQQDLGIIRQELLARDVPYIAIGEVGLDLYWDKTFKEQQIDALKTQLNWALELNLPVVIHSRDAYTELFEILSTKEYRDVRGVIHSFTGTLKELAYFLPLENWFIGINGIVTFKNSSLSEVVKEIPLERLLLETDAPYLAPVPKRGRRNESAFVVYTLTKCADIKEIAVELLAKITKENTERLFSI